FARERRRARFPAPLEWCVCVRARLRDGCGARALLSVAVRHGATWAEDVSRTVADFHREAVVRSVTKDLVDLDPAVVALQGGEVKRARLTVATRCRCRAVVGVAVRVERLGRGNRRADIGG